MKRSEALETILDEIEICLENRSDDCPGEFVSFIRTWMKPPTEEQLKQAKSLSASNEDCEHLLDLTQASLICCQMIAEQGEK